MRLKELTVLIAISEVLVAVRQNVKIFGTTITPHLVIAQALPRINCPYKYPHAFDNGRKCCRSKFEANDLDKGINCDGKMLGFYSPCCFNDDYRDCKPGYLEQKCKSYSSGMAVLMTSIESSTNGVLLIDFDHQCTKRLASYPIDRSGMGVGYLNGTLVTLGGSESPTAHQYNPVSNSWSSLPDFYYNVQHNVLIPYMEGTDEATLLRFGSHPHNKRDVTSFSGNVDEGWIYSSTIPILEEHVYATCAVQVSLDTIVYGGGATFGGLSRNKIWSLTIPSTQWKDTGLNLTAVSSNYAGCIQMDNGKVLFATSGKMVMDIFDPIEETLSPGPTLPETLDMKPAPFFIHQETVHLLVSQTRMYRLEKNRWWKSVDLDFLPPIGIDNKLVPVPREVFKKHSCA